MSSTDPLFRAVPDPAGTPPAGLPAWAGALPLWVAAHWLWIAPAPGGGMRAWAGGAAAEPLVQPFTGADGPGLPPAPLVVVELAGGGLPANGAGLAALVAPGGLLFLCGSGADAGAAYLQRAAPHLLTAGRHLLLPGDDGGWCLRPAHGAARRLLDGDLLVADSLRAWLGQWRRRVRPGTRGVPCQPFWRDGAVMDLLGGAMSAEALAGAAGHPVHPPFDLLAGMGHQADRRLFFVAERAAARPFVVIKGAQGAAATGLIAEHAALAAVRALADPALTASCPPSWGPFPAGAGAVLVLERYLAAPRLYARLRQVLRPGPPAAHFRRVGGWYAHFAAATRQPYSVLDTAVLEEFIIAPVRKAAERFGPAVVPPTALARLLPRSAAWLGTPIALVAEHGDLWPGNILLPPGGIYMVDWEHYRPAALPGFDLLLFCTSYAALRPPRPFGWATPAAALDHAYGGGGALGRAVRDLLTTGCAASGLPPALIPLLLPAMMARLSLRHAPPDPTLPLNGAARLWSSLLAAWWTRPADGWLERWAAATVSPSTA